MKKAILATKVGMTQIFNENGVLTPVTVLQAGPCFVTQVKTVENDGYSAVQVGYVDKKDKVISKDSTGKKEVKRSHGVNKPLQGHFAKAGVSGKRYLKEFKFENAEEYTLGQEIKADIFEAGDKIDASEKAAVQAKIDSLKAVVDRTANQTDISDADIDALKSGKEDLMNAAQKLFQKMYEQTAGAQGAGQQGAGPDMGGAGQSTSGPADDVVDGDYREV